MQRHATGWLAMPRLASGVAVVFSGLLSLSALAQTKGVPPTAATKPDAGVIPGTGAPPAKNPVNAANGGGISNTTSTGSTAGSPATTTPAPGSNGSAGTPPQGSPSPTTPSAAPGMSGATYAVRLRDLESRVDELKDQIRRSHTRLALLSDTILSGGASGSRSQVEFRNEMSSAFQLTRALFVLDGSVQYNRQDETGALNDQKDIPIFTGSIPPGDHTVQAILGFQGNGFGVFTYLRGYRFEVKSSHSFTAVEGKTMTITVTALEKGGVTTPLEQRPTIEWHEKAQAISAATASPTPTAPVHGGSASGSVSTGGVK